MIHPDVAEAIQQIDAAVMSGDTFYDRYERESLLAYLARWTRELESIPDEGAEENEDPTEWSGEKETDNE